MVPPRSEVQFLINGEEYRVDGSSSAETKLETTLVDFIRDVANLKGTKVVCREGGCGACVVNVATIDPNTRLTVFKAINSCIPPVLSCDGWDIKTIESLGDIQKGYHPIQNRLVNFHGTQCDYCTPGMIMNMKSLLDEKENKVTMKEVDESLDGNLCRCTGYRSILDAFKSLAVDASTDLKRKCSDIEAVLGIVDTGVNSSLKSGGFDMIREISSGRQNQETVEGSPEDGALYKPTTEIEAGWQASGEAGFGPDIPSRKDELFAVIVQCSVPCGKLGAIDPSEALKMHGVVHFISAKDIRGRNNYMEQGFVPTSTSEPIFADEELFHHGQAIGAIIAKTRGLASLAAKKVKVTYCLVKKPQVDVYEALKEAEREGTLEGQIFGTYKTKSDPNVEISQTIQGEFRTGGQYHFHLEPQNCLCIPIEDGMEVFSATQWIDHTQNAVSIALGMPGNRVSVKVRRLGGGFGAKLSRASHIAAICAIAAQATNKPVRIVLDLETNMSLIGKRLPYYFKYEVGFNKVGKIRSLKADIFCDTGFSPNEVTSLFAAGYMQSAYKALGWEGDQARICYYKHSSKHILPGTGSISPSKPGTTQGIALMEIILEHTAHSLNLDDAWSVREVNLVQDGDQILPVFGEINFQGENYIPEMLKEITTTGEYDQRKRDVQAFNQNNRWKKRGLALVPVRYPIEYGFGSHFPATVVIHHFDGTVSCSHAGIEMGHGINTKLSQTIASTFQIPPEKVRILPTNSFTAANGYATGASVTSELSCFAALKAWKIIKERLQPIVEKLKDPSSWEELIKEAHEAKIPLTASYTPSPSDGMKDYNVWVLALTEVEIDVLTGEYKVRRTDLIEDAGKSLSPSIDVGQIEGGYILGQGLWTTEKVLHSPQTGQLLTNRSWNYKIPGSKDIPEDFRIPLLKNAPNMNGILRSKTTGEPIVSSAVLVLIALRNALKAARTHNQIHEWFTLDGPVTPEDVLHSCATSEATMTLTPTPTPTPTPNPL